MSLPESMSRIVIVGCKAHMEDAINAFYCVRSLHLIDHTAGADGLSIGTSLGTNSKASERLLKVKSMEKDLGIDKHVKAPPMHIQDIRTQLSAGGVEAVENEVMLALDKRNDLSHRITELNSKKKNLELLAQIGLDLELYSGYRTITSIVGSVKEDPTEALKNFADITETFKFYDVKAGTGVIAVFCKVSDRDKIAAAIATCGFAEIQVPAGITGPAADALDETDTELEALNTELEVVEKSIEGLRIKHKTFLKASDEELSVQIEKGEVPLHIAVTEYSYILDAWVPTKKYDEVKAKLEHKLDGNVYIELMETRGRKASEAEAVEPRFKTAPTKFNNGKITHEFQYPTKLVSVPKYNEIDPSVLIMFFLPLMFGFMVGDCGYAIPFIILGAYGLKTTHHKDWRAIAVVLFFGGIWAFIFGLLFFGEALGMHFVGHDTIWTGGVNVSWDGLLFGAGAVGTAFPDWFTGLLYEGHGVGKLVEVVLLLKLSIYVGCVHLMIGYLCGFYNKFIQHGFKEAFVEKGGWIFSFLGMVGICYMLTQILGIVQEPRFTGQTALIMMVIALVLVALGVVINLKKEGIQAVLELPGIVGNVLSYARLAAIGMSKAGMALAFNYIVFGLIIGVQNGDVNIAIAVCGIFMFAFLHLVIWTLAILSGGLHALRLQFVELMTKFFEGGGVEYAPMAAKRKQTTLYKTNSEEI